MGRFFLFIMAADPFPTSHIPRFIGASPFLPSHRLSRSFQSPVFSVPSALQSVQRCHPLVPDFLGERTERKEKEMQDAMPAFLFPGLHSNSADLPDAPSRIPISPCLRNAFCWRRYRISTLPRPDRLPPIRENRRV